MNKVLCIGDSHTAGFPDHEPMFGGTCNPHISSGWKKNLKK